MMVSVESSGSAMASGLTARMGLSSGLGVEGDAGDFLSSIFSRISSCWAWVLRQSSASRALEASLALARSPAFDGLHAGGELLELAGEVEEVFELRVGLAAGEELLHLGPVAGAEGDGEQRVDAAHAVARRAEIERAAKLAAGVGEFGGERGGLVETCLPA